jgi:heterodisulfide reductase subunit A
VQDTYDMVVLCSDVQPPEGLADLAQTTGVKLADNGYLAISDANGSGVAASEAGVFVAGCASGPKNIKASIADAQAAASAALAQLDPRLLESEAAPGEQQAQAAIAPAGLAASPDDMRKQIEQLLYALIGQSDT